MSDLYDIAEKSNIAVHNFKMKKAKAVSVPGNIGLDESKMENEAEKTVCFAHELGHQFKNAFYDISSTFETRERQEARATRWAVNELVPVDELLKAFKTGHTEIYDLAEYFNVTEEFIRNAFYIYEVSGELNNIKNN